MHSWYYLRCRVNIFSRNATPPRFPSDKRSASSLSSCCGRQQGGRLYHITNSRSAAIFCEIISAIWNDVLSAKIQSKSLKANCRRVSHIKLCSQCFSTGPAFILKNDVMSSCSRKKAGPVVSKFLSKQCIVRNVDTARAFSHLLWIGATRQYPYPTLSIH